MENVLRGPNAVTADKLVDIAIRQLDVSTDFKRERMDRIKKYENAYAGKSEPHLRVEYEAVLPVFAGMVDTLETEFDDPPYLKFKEDNPADYLAARKIQAAWEKEAFEGTPSSQWALKARWDKHNAILSGRGILKFYAESDPEYKSVFDAVNYRDFHCEPDGGGHLEKHLFCGQESIFRTEEQLKEGAEAGIYDKQQVDEMIARAGNPEYKDELGQDYREKMNRFIALGEDPSTNTYVGQHMYNLCEWGLTYQGKRWYLLFDPYTKQWVRCEPLEELFSGGFWPWVSWATHEDDRVFWSKSYGDDFYPSAMVIVDLVMQEYTNRNKKLLGAKLYDPQMITNPQDLNTAQYRPDAIVEVTVPNGKKLSDSVYEIPVGELGGATIELVNWIESTALRQSGAEDITRMAGGQSGGKGGAKANIIFAQIQQAQKRIGHKAHSYVEAYNQIGTRYIQGLKDHFKGSMAIKVLGPEGYENTELRSVDVSTKHALSIKVSSKREEDQENVFGKKQKADSLELLKDSKNINSKWRDEHILRDLGGWPEEEIQAAMDTQEYADKETMAKASLAIGLLTKGKQPLVYHKANVWFMEKIYNYALEHKEKLGPKYMLFLQYVDAHKMIAAENMAKLAGEINAGRKPMPGVGATPGGQQDASAAAAAVKPSSGPGGAMVRNAGGVGALR